MLNSNVPKADFFYTPDGFFSNSEKHLINNTSKKAAFKKNLLILLESKPSKELNSEAQLEAYFDSFYSNIEKKIPNWTLLDAERAFYITDEVYFDSLYERIKAKVGRKSNVENIAIWWEANIGFHVRYAKFGLACLALCSMFMLAWKFIIEKPSFEMQEIAQIDAAEYLIHHSLVEVEYHEISNSKLLDTKWDILKIQDADVNEIFLTDEL